MRTREKRKLAKKVLNAIEDGKGGYLRSCPDYILFPHEHDENHKTRGTFCHKLFPGLKKDPDKDSCGECPCEELTEKYVRARLRKYIRGEFEI